MKGDRIGEEEDAGEWWRHRKNNEHKGDKTNQVTKFHSKYNMPLSFTTVRYIEIEGVEVTVRRCVATIVFIG